VTAVGFSFMGGEMRSVLDASSFSLAPGQLAVQVTVYSVGVGLTAASPIELMPISDRVGFIESLVSVRPVLPTFQLRP